MIYVELCSETEDSRENPTVYHVFLLQFHVILRFSRDALLFSPQPLTLTVTQNVNPNPDKH